MPVIMLTAGSGHANVAARTENGVCDHIARTFPKVNS